MERRFVGYTRLIFSWLLLWLLAFGPLLASPSRAQDFSTSVPQKDQGKLRALAASIIEHGDGGAWLMTQLHLDGRMTELWPSWRSWPSVRMLEAAYTAAEAANPKSGGQLVLRHAATILEEDVTSAIRGEGALQEYFAMEKLPRPSAGSIIQLERPSEQAAVRAIPEKIRIVVEVIAHHVENIPGGVGGALGYCCRLTDVEKYEVERNASSVSDAISRGMELKEPPPPEEKTWRLIEWVADWNGAAVYDEGWREYANVLRALPGATAARRFQIQSMMMAAVRPEGAQGAGAMAEDSVEAKGAAIVDKTLTDLRSQSHQPDGNLPPTADDQRAPNPAGSDKTKAHTENGKRDEAAFVAAAGTDHSQTPPGSGGPGVPAGGNPTELKIGSGKSFPGAMANAVPPNAPPGTSGSTAGPERTASSSAHPGSSGSSAIARGAEGRFESFTSRLAAESSSLSGEAAPLSFKGLRGFRGGFGGVVFGNEVRGDAHLPKLKSLRWVPYGDGASRWSRDIEAWGHIEFAFEDGSSGWSSLMPADHARVAYDLLWGNPEYSPDKGYGMVGFLSGLLRAVPWHGHVLEREKGARFVVNPIVSSSHIVRAAEMLDLMGYAPENWGTVLAPDVVAQAYAAGASDAEANQILEWRNLSKGDYKFVDVPMTITRSPDGVIKVSRQQVTETPLDSKLLASSFITMQNFDAIGKPLDEDIDIFYRKVPLFISVSDVFDRVNEFAAQFAMLRWAKESSANWEGMRPQNSNLAFPAAVLFGWKGIQFVESETALDEELVRGVQAEAVSILGKNANPALIKASQKLTEDRLAALSYRVAIDILGGEQLIVERAAKADPSITVPEGLSSGCPNRDSDTELNARIPELRALIKVCQLLEQNRDSEPHWKNNHQIFHFVANFLDPSSETKWVDLNRRIAAEEEKYDKIGEEIDDLETLDLTDGDSIMEYRLSHASEAQRHDWRAYQDALNSADTPPPGRISDAEAKKRRAAKAVIISKLAALTASLPAAPTQDGLRAALKSKRGEMTAQQGILDEIDSKFVENLGGPAFERWKELQSSYEESQRPDRKFMLGSR